MKSEKVFCFLSVNDKATCQQGKTGHSQLFPVTTDDIHTLPQLGASETLVTIPNPCVTRASLPQVLHFFKVPILCLKDSCEFWILAHVPLFVLV